MNLGRLLLSAALIILSLSSCREQASGPITVSAIGGAPALRNPNLVSLDPPSATLTEAVAQGLVRFDAAGQVEPALAERWLVSDDGLRFTFKIARAEWANGTPVTAEHVEARLKAAVSRSSKNPLKPLLGAVADIQAMTDHVLEISLRAPRPNFLQLLAQPELSIIRNGVGTGPYEAETRSDGAILLRLPDEEDEDAPASDEPEIVLRGETAAVAVARFRRQLADLVIGGTVGDLPVARAATLPGGALQFDPASGFFGVAFGRNQGPLASSELRQALSMAIDRPALVAALGVPGLAARESLLPGGIEELPNPAVPAWSALPLPARREAALRLISGIAQERPLRLRMAVPDEPGYKLVFAHLRRDWRLVGVEVEAAGAGSKADLIMIDAVAAANLATWYLRRFACNASAICSVDVDTLLEGARSARSAAERQTFLADADRALTDISPFIPLTAPVRWSLVSARLQGYRANPFARHFVGSLLAARR